MDTCSGLVGVKLFLNFLLHTAHTHNNKGRNVLAYLFLHNVCYLLFTSIHLYCVKYPPPSFPIIGEPLYHVPSNGIQTMH